MCINTQIIFVCATWVECNFNSNYCKAAWFNVNANNVYLKTRWINYYVSPFVSR